MNYRSNQSHCSALPGHGVPQMLPGRPDITTVSWRPTWS